MDVDITINIDFFICDLYRQIETLHKQQQIREIFTIYREQWMNTKYDLRCLTNRIREEVHSQIEE